MKKSVLITGTNHGLGLSLVKVFLDKGFTVFAGVYKLDNESQIHCLKDKYGLFLVDMNVSDTRNIQEAVDFVSNFTKSIDIIINNAGILSSDGVARENNTIFDHLDFDSMLEVYNVNALGSLRVTNAFLPLLMNGSGKLLINISSEAGSISDCARTGWFGYCMSKAALNMSGAIIQNELVKHGGQVWQVHPGYVQTYMHGEMNEAATHTPDFSAEQIYKLIQNTDKYKSQDAVYIDLFGNKMNW